VSDVAVYVDAVISYAEQTGRGSVHLEKALGGEVRFDLVALELRGLEGCDGGAVAYLVPPPFQRYEDASRAQFAQNLVHLSAALLVVAESGV
jgi:hypothetical protein